MYNCLVKRSRRTKRSFLWHRNIPRKLKELKNSAFLQNVAEAYLRRKMIFREGEEEEYVKALRFKKLSKTSVFVQFVIRTNQRISESSRRFEVFDEVYVTVVCNYHQQARFVKLMLLDAVSDRSIENLLKKISKEIDSKRYYTFGASKGNDNRFYVNIAGSVFTQIPRKNRSNEDTTCQVYFAERNAILEINPCTGWVRRLT